MARRKGFSLIELIVVLVIIGILAMVVGVRVGDTLTDARQTRIEADLAMLLTATEQFAQRYPEERATTQTWPCHQRKNRRTDEGNLTLCDGEGCSYTGREKNHAYYGIIHRAVHRTG